MDMELVQHLKEELEKARQLQTALSVQLETLGHVRAVKKPDPVDQWEIASLT